MPMHMSPASAYHQRRHDTIKEQAIALVQKYSKNGNKGGGEVEQAGHQKRDGSMVCMEGSATSPLDSDSVAELDSLAEAMHIDHGEDHKRMKRGGSRKGRMRRGDGNEEECIQESSGGHVEKER